MLHRVATATKEWSLTYFYFTIQVGFISTATASLDDGIQFKSINLASGNYCHKGVNMAKAYLLYFTIPVGFLSIVLAVCGTCFYPKN